MRGWTGLWVGIVASLGSGCTPVATSQPATLSQKWMIGVERMRDNSLLMAPFTNRFLAVLAGMPGTQLVYVGAPRNDPLFSAYTGNKLAVHSWLRGEGNCMEFTYVVFASGQQQATYSLVIPALPAGPEPDFGLRRSRRLGFLPGARVAGAVRRRDVAARHYAASRPGAGPNRKPISSSSIAGSVAPSVPKAMRASAALRSCSSRMRSSTVSAAISL